MYHSNFFKHQNQLSPMSVLSPTGRANSGSSWFFTDSHGSTMLFKQEFSNCTILIHCFAPIKKFH